MSVRDKIFRACARFDASLLHAQKRVGRVLIPKVVLIHYRQTPHRCFYCGVEFGEGDANLSYDHIKPILHGGRRTPGNIVPACDGCNNRKGSRNAKQFRRQFPDRKFWAEVAHGCMLDEKIELQG